MPAADEQSPREKMLAFLKRASRPASDLSPNDVMVICDWAHMEILRLDAALASQRAEAQAALDALAKLERSVAELAARRQPAEPKE
jgi:hypothetical protein